MKLGIIYFLVLCIFSFKGYGCVPSGQYKNLSGNSSASNIQNSRSTETGIRQNMVDFLQDSLLNDDDELESARKKEALHSPGATHNNIITLIYLSNLFANNQWPGNHFYPSIDKHIFLRVMKL